MEIQDFIDDINNGLIEDVKKYFNDLNTFFHILKKRGLLDEIDIEGGSDACQNELLLFFYETDKEKFYYWVNHFLSNVEHENGKTYLILDERGELAELYCDGRNDISQKTIESMLDGEYDRDFYYHDSVDVYDEVIKNLNKENVQYLKEVIVEKLKDVKISPNSEELELIASEQEHDEYVEINLSNISRVFADKETMIELFNDDLSDMGSELSNIYSNAYNTAYEDELYDKIFNAIDDFFVGHGEFVNRPSPHKEIKIDGVVKKGQMVQKYRIRIVDFENEILSFLKNDYYSLEYWGSYLSILKDNHDCVSVWSPDYADYRKVEKYINEMLKEYL